MASHGDGSCPHCGVNLAYDGYDGKRRSRAWLHDASDEYGRDAWVYQCPDCGKTWHAFSPDTRLVDYGDDGVEDEFPPIAL